MMKPLAILFVLCALCSCAATGAPPHTDWQALESTATITGALQFLPEVEPVNLRVNLFHFEFSVVDRISRLIVGGAPRVQPFGVDLGNGLAIDSSGTAFLDILKLLRIDTGVPFRVERKSDSLLGKGTTLVRDNAGISLRSPWGRGTVLQTEKGLSLRNAAGKDDMTVTFSQGTYGYKSTTAFDFGSEMKAADDQLTISGAVLLHTLSIVRDGDSVIFNPSSDENWPQYTVTKQGDAYSVRFRGSTADITFKIYFTGDSVYLVQNGIVALSVKTTGSSILVDGKELVSYSRD